MNIWNWPSVLAARLDRRLNKWAKKQARRWRQLGHLEQLGLLVAIFIALVLFVSWLILRILETNNLL